MGLPLGTGCNRCWLGLQKEINFIKKKIPKSLGFFIKRIPTESFFLGYVSEIQTQQLKTQACILYTIQLPQISSKNLSILNPPPCPTKTHFQKIRTPPQSSLVATAKKKTIPSSRFVACPCFLPSNHSPFQGADESEISDFT